MIKLNLQAESQEFEALKMYLEENVSDALAEKINNGVRIEKDGKTLINKKTLETFMGYSHDEAKKLVAQGARYACIRSDVVFGWAMHYFEEDSIEGTLFNEDGTPYKSTPKPLPKAPAKTTAPTTATVVTKPNKPETKQFTLFDLMGGATEQERKQEQPQEKVQESVQEEISINELNVDKETGEILNTKPFPVRKPTSLYQKYLQYRNEYPDHVLAYRVGDFYEFFGEDAILLSNYLNLTLTGRDCGLEERVAMVGIPYHAADKYFSKITDQYPLVIVDNDNASIMRAAQDEDGDDTDMDEPICENPPTMYEDNEQNDDLDDVDYMQYIDTDALIILSEIFEDKLDVQ